MSANRPYSPANPAGYEVTLTREFTAPRELVFQAWTDVDQLRQWWGPEGFTNPVCKFDARKGGAIDIHMRAPDGTIYPMAGTMTEVVANEKLVFTNGALDGEGKLLFNILTTVTFADAGKKTRLTVAARVIDSTREGSDYIGGLEDGWLGSLDKLAAYSEKGHDKVQ